MPDSDTDGFRTAGLVILVFAMIGLIAFQRSGYEHVEGVPNDYEASQYHERAKGRVEIECSGLDAIDFAKCSNEIERAERNAHQAQKDLKA